MRVGLGVRIVAELQQLQVSSHTHSSTSRLTLTQPGSYRGIVAPIGVNITGTCASAMCYLHQHPEALLAGVGKMYHDRAVGSVVIFGKFTLMSMFPSQIIVLMSMFPSRINVLTNRCYEHVKDKIIVPLSKFLCQINVLMSMFQDQFSLVIIKLEIKPINFSLRI